MRFALLLALGIVVPVHRSSGRSAEGIYGTEDVDIPPHRCKTRMGR